jgi:vacuolar-type H+-ATPase catalytic subunit A/Vma1
MTFKVRDRVRSVASKGKAAFVGEVVKISGDEYVVRDYEDLSKWFRTNDQLKLLARPA